MYMQYKYYGSYQGPKKCRVVPGWKCWKNCFKLLNKVGRYLINLIKYLMSNKPGSPTLYDTSQATLCNRVHSPQVTSNF